MNSDLIELLQLLNDHKVKYLLIGGQAVIVHSEPRYTKDVDLWVAPSATNAKKILAALEEFGAPTSSVTEEDFATPGTVFIFGVEPNRVDILTRVKGAKFDASYKNRDSVQFQGVKVSLISLSDLIKVKPATGRPQDLLDLEKFLRTRKLLNKKAAKKR
jgi:predicted nucleotidyltransferase